MSYFKLPSFSFLRKKPVHADLEELFALREENFSARPQAGFNSIGSARFQQGTPSGERLLSPELSPAVQPQTFHGDPAEKTPHGDPADPTLENASFASSLSLEPETAAEPFQAAPPVTKSASGQTIKNFSEKITKKADEPKTKKMPEGLTTEHTSEKMAGNQAAENFFKVSDSAEPPSTSNGKSIFSLWNRLKKTREKKNISEKTAPLRAMSLPAVPGDVPTDVSNTAAFAPETVGMQEKNNGSAASTALPLFRQTNRKISSDGEKSGRFPAGREESKNSLENNGLLRELVSCSRNQLKYLRKNQSALKSSLENNFYN